RGTPSGGHVASSTEPTRISPGPSQIAARIFLSPRSSLALTLAAAKIAEIVRQLEVYVAEFIFMLTRDDETVTDARAIYESIADSGVRHVGCKDIGLPREELSRLLDNIRANGHTSYLEVVSETDEAELQSARVAAEVGPDYLIGGTLIEPVEQI